ncbi:MAG: GatB/YqeY domain-containing protein [Candidatus Sumerlaeaceae bacterium]|nr:GatB/YqeY domain-containing protein [Candidatus Sumerlaeaceae bacterium]
MDIKAQIQKDRMEAMKTRNAAAKSTLDYILGEIQKKEKDPSAKGDIATAVIAAYLKSLREFIAQFATERPEQSAVYQAEITQLEQYLPKQLSADELRAEIQALQAAGQDKKGLIMKALKEKHGAAMDGKAAATILDELGIK